MFLGVRGSKYNETLHMCLKEETILEKYTRGGYGGRTRRGGQ